MTALVTRRVTFNSGSIQYERAKKLRRSSAVVRGKKLTFSCKRLRPERMAGRRPRERKNHTSTSRKYRGAAVRGQQLGHANPPCPIFGYPGVKQSEPFVRLETIA